MGSGTSKAGHIHSLKIEPSNDLDSKIGRQESPHSNDVFCTKMPNDADKENLKHLLTSRFQGNLTETKQIVEIYDEKIKDLEHKLAESESENLDHLDRIQSLEDQLKCVKSLPSVTEENDSLEELTEIIKSKDDYISKVEQEKQIQETENNKIKSRLKKKIRLLKQELNEAKQETSIQMFEMKDEIMKLNEENEKLKKQTCKSVNGNTEVNSNSMDNNKMLIVVELSNQVSEQAEKLHKMEQELESKDRIIQDLLSKVPKKSVCPSRSSLERDRNEENEFNLHKLSQGLQGYIKPAVTETSVTHREESGDSRFSSGASRDSGLGHKLSSKGAKNKYNSDSDEWDSDEPTFTSKIRSAPVDTISRRTSSRGSSVGGLSPFPYAEDGSSCKIKKNKTKKMSFLQRHFQTNTEQQSSPVPIHTDAFSKESTFDELLLGNSKEEKSHFFITEADASSTVLNN